MAGLAGDGNRLTAGLARTGSRLGGDRYGLTGRRGTRWHDWRSAARQRGDAWQPRHRTPTGRTRARTARSAAATTTPRSGTRAAARAATATGAAASGAATRARAA